MFPGQHGRRLRRRPACPAIGQRAADALGPPWIGRYVYTHLSLSLSIYIYIYISIPGARRAWRLRSSKLTSNEHASTTVEFFL